MSLDAADPAARLQAAVGAHRAGHLDEAEQHYRAVLVQEPENPNALHLLGVVYRQRGQPETAAALITQALQYAPALADAHANLGNAYSDMRLFEPAVQAYEHARQLGSRGPDNDRRLVAALEAAAAVHMAAGRREEARPWLERALVEAPDRVEIMQALLPFYVAEDRLHALTMAARAWHLRPDRDGFRLLWDLCNRAGEDLDLAHAHRAARPDDPFRMIALGNALRRARRGWEAEALYRAAIGIEPPAPFATMRLACLLLEQGRIEAAEHCLRLAEQGDPGRVRTMQFSGAFFRRLARRPLPLPPAGFVPPPAAPGVVVFSACDGGYFEQFASALLNSAHRNSGLDQADSGGTEAACRYHLHVVNPPPDAKERVEAYRAMLGGVPIELSTETVDTADWDDERCRTWFACARFRLLPHLMEAYAAPILMLDADMLVLRDLRGLIALASGGDVAAVATERHVCEPWNWFWADVVFLNATDRALAFADLVARYVEHHLQAAEAHWFLDQIALTACLLAGFPDGAAPRFVALPTDIHRLSLVCRDGVDEPPGPHVLFWSAHASTVDTSMTLLMPRYQDYVLAWPPAAFADAADAVLSGGLSADPAGGGDADPTGGADANLADSADSDPTGGADAGSAHRADADPVGRAGEGSADGADADLADGADADPTGGADAASAHRADADPVGRAGEGSADGADADLAGVADANPAGGADAGSAHRADANPVGGAGEGSADGASADLAGGVGADLAAGTDADLAGGTGADVFVAAGANPSAAGGGDASQVGGAAPVIAAGEAASSTQPLDAALDDAAAKANLGERSGSVARPVGAAPDPGSLDPGPADAAFSRPTSSDVAYPGPASSDPAPSDAASPGPAPHEPASLGNDAAERAEQATRKPVPAAA